MQYDSKSIFNRDLQDSNYAFKIEAQNILISVSNKFST